ncbi:MAG TPA: hypothetical protein VFT75_18540 [Nocardioidaceae bacterium]|nr:hypothetical protein [Nocardioidaceae bacterium]
MSTQARYYVLDRQRGQDANLARWSAVNPRYLVMDRETGQDVDQFTTRRAAADTAAMMNATARAGAQ